MIFPAWFDLATDDEIAAQPTALRVYARLIKDYHPSIFFAPQEVKAWALAEMLGTHRDRVADAIALLIERGYVVEHGRAMSNVRLLILPMERVHSAAKTA